MITRDQVRCFAVSHNFLCYFLTLQRGVKYLSSFDKLCGWNEGGSFPECCFPAELLSGWWELDLDFFTMW